VVVLLNFERDLHAAALAGVRFDRSQQRSANSSTAIAGKDGEIVNVDQRSRSKGREAEEAGRDPRCLALEICQQDDRRRVLPQRGNQPLENLRRQRATVAHDILCIRRCEVDYRPSMFRLLEVGFDDMHFRAH